MSSEVTSTNESQINPEEIAKVIEQADPKAFNGLQKSKRINLIKQVAALTINKTHVGPLPDPETLEGYSQLIPDGAERIMRMAEKQQEHRIDLEKEALRRQFNQSNLGQIFAFVLGLVSITGAIYVISQGHQWPGVVFGGLGLTGLVTAFIQGKRQQSNSLQKKA